MSESEALREAMEALRAQVKRLTDALEKPGHLSELEKWSVALQIAAASQTDDVDLLKQKIRSLRALVSEFDADSQEPHR